jgi:nicotinamidase-related amidase
LGDSPRIEVRLKTGDALVLVDLQNDFLPGGSLAVATGWDIVAAANGYIDRFRRLGLPIFATRCWHPPGHVSFLGSGGPWPVHCVAGTAGSRFPESLLLPSDAAIVSKGQLAEKDAYSAFDGTAFAEILDESGIGRLLVGGLTAEFCVRRTVLDAIASEFTVFLLVDAVGAVDSLGGEQALADMAFQGAHLIRIGDLAC